MTEINKKEISYLGFDWVEEVKNAILGCLDTFLEETNELPQTVDELQGKLNFYLGGSGYPASCSMWTQNIYEAVVSNTDLITLTYDNWGISLGERLGDRTLFEACNIIALDIQNFLITELSFFSDDEYINLTSSINKQAQIEALQQAVIHNAEKFKTANWEDLTPIIDNPLDLKAPAREALIAGLEERGYINNSQNKSFLANKKIPSLYERANSARSVSEAQQKSRSPQVKTFDRERG